MDSFDHFNNILDTFILVAILYVKRKGVCTTFFCALASSNVSGICVHV